MPPPPSRRSISALYLRRPLGSRTALIQPSEALLCERTIRPDPARTSPLPACKSVLCWGRAFVVLDSTHEAARRRRSSSESACFSFLSTNQKLYKSFYISSFMFFPPCSHYLLFSSVWKSLSWRWHEYLTLTIKAITSLLHAVLIYAAVGFY